MPILFKLGLVHQHKLKKEKKKECGTENAGLANIHCLTVTENEDKVLMWSFHNKDILYYNSR